MIKINYPDKKPLIKNEAGKEFIFCIIRKRWIIITPEEWVRQNFLLFLIDMLHYPASLIAVEKQLTIGDVKKRFDIVVYDKETKPFMIVECKEMNVSLSEKVLQQVNRYNTNMQATYLIITNGTQCVGFIKENNILKLIEQFPDHNN